MKPSPNGTLKKMKLTFKAILYISLNIVLSFLLYFISLRPLSPSEEQLISNFKYKTFFAFTIETLLFCLLLTFIFSAFSYVFFWFFFRKVIKIKGLPLIIFMIYLVISFICSLEYYNYVINIIYNK
ncbi:hypothetical protein SAMN05443547_0007 [Flavobacterium cucumis]|uniref:Uncharacterized protein n=1 Tax=Flavobacterium cucumis TaxID=416016 RepID=A0A1M7ZZR7_9FLAO|nr:hypothetical protein SAMN05443547_0007 [Flavobacterium cucumis]